MTAFQSFVRLITLLAGAVLIGAAAGCRSTPPLRAAPDWSVRTGQAVWRPSAGEEALAGDLVLAEGADGFLIEFSKPPFSVVHVIRRGDAWEIGGMGGRVRRGRGEAPEALWFELGSMLSGNEVAIQWRGHQGADGEFRLERPETGESIEGFLAP